VRRRGIALMALLLGGAVALRSWVGWPLQVVTDGMAPTVAAGDVVWVSQSTPAVGEVVRVRMAPDEDPQLARLVAGPGQTVEVARGVLYVDGVARTLGQEKTTAGCGDRSWVQRMESWDHGTGWVVPGKTVASVVVPAGHGFVLGDNRPSAGDSQKWGPVALIRIGGVATHVLWSFDGCGGSRWSRLGKRINWAP